MVDIVGVSGGQPTKGAVNIGDIVEKRIGSEIPEMTGLLELGGEGQLRYVLAAGRGVLFSFFQGYKFCK